MPPRQKLASSTYYLPVSRISSDIVVSGGLDLPGTVIHFPWWFPGAGFNKEAKTWKGNVELSRDGLYETVERMLVRIVLHQYS
jgi:hypothetical protein